MIIFRKKDTSVEVGITVSVPYYESRELHFQWECSSEIFAGLLTAELRTQLYNKLEEIRADAYEAGWRLLP